MFSSILSSNIYQAVSKWALSNKEKNIIIDPLCCFIKLSLLNFYPEGKTKYEKDKHNNRFLLFLFMIYIKKTQVFVVFFVC